MLSNAAGFISPHIDDAVLSCAGTIAPGSVVVTVFAAGPASVDPLPLWDRECGVFKPGDNVPLIRAREDDAALAQLQATGVRLDFWDREYVRASMSSATRARRRLARAVRGSQSDPQLRAAVTERLARTVGELGLPVWVAPLGLRHSDHQLTNEAVLALVRDFNTVRWVLYEDLPYAREDSQALRVAMKRVESAGFSLQDVTPRPSRDSAAKRAAVEHYTSQLPALGQRVDVAIRGPEAYHLLVTKRG